MKKIMVALGIAFALIVGVIFGSMMNNTASAVSETEPVTIEEAAANYLIESHPRHEIDNVEVVDIYKDENYGGGYRIAVEFDRDGDSGWYTQIAASSLGEFEF